MRFLLIRSEGSVNIEANDSLYSPGFLPPLSLLYIGSALEHDGHNVEIIDYACEPFSPERLEDALRTADAVGLSVYTDKLPLARTISSTIKSLHPNIPIIIGGPHCIFLQKQSLHDIPHADICVAGEGEKAIVEIAHALEGRKKLSEISGIYYRKHTNIYKGKPVSVIKDLDTIHFPSRRLVEKYKYGTIGKKFLFTPPLTSMITSRGCPFHCRFCARYSNAIQGWGSRKRSAENVIQEFQEINKTYGSVMIVDDNFILDKKRAHNIIDGLIEIGTTIDILIMGARVDSADPELFEKMKKAHVKLIGFGIESGNQDVLDFYKKGFTIEQAKNAVSMSRKMGFKTLATFILGAPIETKKHFDNTIKFSCSIPLDFVIYGVLHYEMGSDLWKTAVNEKKISKNEFLVAADKNRDLGNYSEEYLEEYCLKAYRHFYLRPRYLINQILRGFIQNDLQSLRTGVKFLKASKQK